MKKSIFNLPAFLALVFFSLQLDAQKSLAEAETFFSNYKTTKTITELIAKSLPTLEDCKTVFKEAYAQTYFNHCESMKEKISAELNKVGETFVDIGIESFVTKDIKDGKGNYAGGMSRILSKLQNNITFYKVDQLRTVGADSGMAYKYWVHINNRWVFFPKPWQAFKD